MNYSNFFFILFFFLSQSCIAAHYSEKPCTKLESQKQKIASKQKKRDRKNGKTAQPKDEGEYHSLPADQLYNKLINESIKRYKQAEDIELSIAKTYTNANEVSLALIRAAELYEAASRTVRENLKITRIFANKIELDQNINSLASQYDLKAKNCRQHAAEWPIKLIEKKNANYKKLEELKNELSLAETKESKFESNEIYKKIAAILEHLISNGEPDTGELASVTLKLAEFATSIELLHSNQRPSLFSQEEFQQIESARRDCFYQKTKSTDRFSYPPVPLDGQDSALHLKRFYRYLIEKDNLPLHLNIKVFKDSEEIHHEMINISFNDDSWEDYLVTKGSLFIPKTSLADLYGLDLRLQIFYNPYKNFSMVVTVNGSESKYNYSFFLDDEPLYEIQFIPQLPWQLESICEPVLATVNVPTEFHESYNPDIKCEEVEISPLEKIQFPMLDQFVEELKRDPLALIQYIYNEIEFVDPFLAKDSMGVFQAPGILRSPLRTFTEKRGSPWEQCILLRYLLKKAGFQTQYIEGTCSLPSCFAENLFFLQFPGQEEILVDYPGIRFYDGEKWVSLFPWMKDVSIIEGYDVYSILPEKYASAERWVLQYLCNDENILKHVGLDGDDTAGVLFIKHLEECLRNQGLSLQDVGSRREIRKKQFKCFEDFPRPKLIGNIKMTSNISNRWGLYALMEITIQSEQNPSRKMVSTPIVVSNFSCGAFSIYSEPDTASGELLHFEFADTKEHFSLRLDASDKTLGIEVLINIPTGTGPTISNRNKFSITKGTCAALCFQSGITTSQITSDFADKFVNAEKYQDKLNALQALVGTAYFEKCSRTNIILAALHKIPLPLYYSIGIAKLSPESMSNAYLKYPQVDMHDLIGLVPASEHPFSTHHLSYLSHHNYTVLKNVDSSSNEHQILREIYQDPYAISTVKLLQIAHQNHKKAGGIGPGFLIFCAKKFADADVSSESAQLFHFANINCHDLSQLKSKAKEQWEAMQKVFNGKGSNHAIAYMTPEPVSSQDGFGLIPPSYTGYGTLINSPGRIAALISSQPSIMNGGFGTKLSNDFVQNVTSSTLQLFSYGNGYSLVKTSENTDLDLKIKPGVTKYPYEIIIKTEDMSSHALGWKNNSTWHSVVDDEWFADVRKEHKSQAELVQDPVDVVTGSFYVDDIDLNIPGAFPIEVRRNYSSKKPLHGQFGYGWKLSLNPILFEEDDKLFAAEMDGTVIVYRYEPDLKRWTVHPEDNPELKNYSNSAIGSAANPFNGYIEKNENHILYGSDGSKRIFHNNLLEKWFDHSGNTLSFTYKDENLTRIESSSGGFISFVYDFSGRIIEASARDGRRITYTYDHLGNLASITLPNNSMIKYEYDLFHRIIRETKPHGRVLENIYKDGKVIEQRSPIGPYQQMATSATFAYQDDLTTVTDAKEGVTEYKIYNNQVYKITDPEGNQTFQSWFIDNHFYFDAENEDIKHWEGSGGYPRTLKCSKDKRGLTTNYLYDIYGNVKVLTLEGEDLTGNYETSVSKNFHYNDCNLCILEETLNTKTVHIYDNDNPYLHRRTEKFVDDILVSFTQMDYTQNGLIKTINQSGAFTHYIYDERDFLKIKTLKSGSEDPDVVLTYHYNNQGQCVEHITQDAVQHDDYDIMGNLYHRTISLQNGKKLSEIYFGHDQNNEIIWIQGNEFNDTIYFDYDASGHLKAKRKSLSQIKNDTLKPAGIAYTLYEYDSCGGLIENVDPNGNCTYFTNDALGRVVLKTLDGHSTKYTYEPGGLVASVTTPGGAISTREYTTNGSLKCETLPDETKHLIVYDLLGRVVQETSSGIVSTIQYNDAAFEEIHFEGEFKEIHKFDARGNLISFTDKAGYTLYKTYDSLNRVKTETSPNGEVTKWNYIGDTIICTLPSGEYTKQRFEAGVLVESQGFSQDGKQISSSILNKYPTQSMTEEVIGDISVSTWTNTHGQPVRVQQGKKITIHHYDPCGNRIATEDEEGYYTFYEYDLKGSLKKKTLPDGSIVNYTYDADSNLIEYQMPGELTWKATYDPVGRKKSEWQESNNKPFQKSEYVYKDGRLIKVTDSLNRQFNYDYDANGRLKKISVDDFTREYTYDPRSLLASVTEKGTDVTKVERHYDSSGRLIQENISLNGIILQESTQTWTSSNRTLEIGNHKRDFYYQGGRLSGLVSGDFALNYNYDLGGALISKISPFSSMEIKYNNSALPEYINVKLGSKNYDELITWTSSGKLSSRSTTYPQSQFEEFTYNSRGFLKTTNNNLYEFDFDRQGRGIRTSTTDLKVPLNGIDEKGRVIKENSETEEFNAKYDDMGQVIMHNDDLLTWDPWGRLVSIKNDNYEWTASYDALGRRLQTRYTPKSSLMFLTFYGKTSVTNSLYDPEHEFQEIGVSYGDMTYWKLYGSSICDAVMDSNNNILVLHHDMRHNLQAVISKHDIEWNETYPSPYGPSTLPENEFNDLYSFALSLSWQSKQKDITGLIWLGARYYDPVGGRFLSPDPINYPSCLDLYVFADGDPINNVDPDGRCAIYAYETTPVNNIESYGSKLPAVYFDDVFEQTLITADRSRRFHLGRPELPNGLRIIAGNGINNTFEEAVNTALYISDLAGGYNVHFIYGAKYTNDMDIASCIFGLKFRDTGRVNFIHAELKEHYNLFPNVSPLMLFHSRGCIDLRNALLCYDEVDRKKTWCVGIAPGGYIYSETCGRVTHYHAPSHRDPIPQGHFYTDYVGAEREKHTTVTLKSHQDAPLFDHSIFSPTYQEVIRKNIAQYVKSEGKFR